MNYQVGLISLLMVGALPVEAQDPARIPLQQSEAVALSMVKDADRTTYEMVLRGEGGGAVIWKHEVPDTAGPPGEWSKLLAADGKDGKIVALLELNETTVMLVRYDMGTNEVRESRIFAPNLLMRARSNAGTFKLMVPDQLELVGEKGDSQSFLIKDDRFLDDEGNDVEAAETRIVWERNRLNRSGGDAAGGEVFPMPGGGSAGVGKKTADPGAGSSTGAAGGKKAAEPGPVSDRIQSRSAGRDGSTTSSWVIPGMAALVVCALVVLALVYKKASRK